MTVVRAHFNGEVFVPDGPVNCPKDMPLRLHIEPEPDRPLAGLADLAEKLPDEPNWPTDGAFEHDHYLYGTPKKGT